MQTQRLFEIVYILLRKHKITAKELAEHFEVSTRTIYRDLDTLSMAGIPLYTNKGSGGGIFLMEDYTLSKSLLSDEEQQHILSALQSYHITDHREIASLLNKLSAQFQKDQIPWIEVDFHDWDTNHENYFQILKEAILGKQVIAFTYYNSYGQKNYRHVEPLRLLFKSQAWYLIAYCLDKHDQRMFKLCRMKDVQMLHTPITHTLNEEALAHMFQYPKEEQVHIKAHVGASMAFRIYDEFTPEDYEKLEDGSFLLHLVFPPGDWLYSYLMGFGDTLRVIEPSNIRDEIKRRLQHALHRYEENER